MKQNNKQLQNSEIFDLFSTCPACGKIKIFCGGPNFDNTEIASRDLNNPI